MNFQLKQYNPPDFTRDFLKNAPDACLESAALDTVAPENFFECMQRCGNIVIGKSAVIALHGEILSL